MFNNVQKRTVHFFFIMEEQQRLFHNYQCLERYLSYIQDVRDSLQKRNDKVLQCIKTFEQNQIIIKQNQKILSRLDNLTEQMEKIDDDQYIQLLNVQLADALERKKKLEKQLYANINELKGYEEYRFRTDEDVFNDRIPLPPQIDSDTYRKLKYELEEAKRNTKQKEEQWKKLIETNIDFCSNNEQATNIDIVYDKIEVLENQIHSAKLQMKEKKEELSKQENENDNQDEDMTREMIVKAILDRIRERKAEIPITDLQKRSTIHTIENVFHSMLKNDMDNDRFMMVASSLKTIGKQKKPTSLSAKISPIMGNNDVSRAAKMRTPEKLSPKQIEERKRKILETAQKYGFVYDKK